MKYRFSWDEFSEKWGVIDKKGNYIMFSETKEGAIQIMDDLNGVGR